MRLKKNYLETKKYIVLRLFEINKEKNKLINSLRHLVITNLNNILYLYLGIFNSF